MMPRQHYLALVQTLASLDWRSVATSRSHSAAVMATRLKLIDARVRAVAALCAIATLAWIALDVAVLPRTIWAPLAVIRVLTAITLLVIASHAGALKSFGETFGWFVGLFAILTAFFLFAQAELSGAHLPTPLAAAYIYTPFILVAALALFPLTIIENTAIGLPLLVIFVISIYVRGSGGMAWPLTLVAVVAAISGMSQLKFLIEAVELAANDKLTGVYSRRFGEQVLQTQFETAQRSGSPLSLVFLDLDHFKAVNDGFGHEAGDRVLRQTAHKLTQVLRGQDTVIRWGGEEFVILMPNTTADQALDAVHRIAAHGLGSRPDGDRQTASIGVAERESDALEDCTAMIFRADGRMYAAKGAGRNRIIGCDDNVRKFIGGSRSEPVQRLRAV